MYKLCKTKKTAARQQSIEDTLIRLMQIKPFRLISVSEICREAQVPRNTFYSYFDTKQDILVSLLDRKMLEYNANLIFSSPDDITAATICFFDYWYQNRTLLNALDGNGLNSLLIERIIKLELERSRGVEWLQSGISSDIQQWVLRFDCVGVIDLLFSWVRSGTETPEEMAKLINLLHSEPVFSRVERRVL